MSNAETFDFAETSLSGFGSVPGRLRLLEIPGVEGRITDLNHPLANLVSRARLGPDNVSETINRVWETYGESVFGWMVGPASTPDDLGDRLLARGAAHESNLDLLLLENLVQPIHGNPDVEIIEVSPREAADHTAMMAASFGLTEDLIRLFLLAYEQLPPNRTVRVYLASLDGTPVSWGVTQHDRSSGIALLAGAATIEAHRGRGVYTSLVARRLDDLNRSGAKAAIIQAVPTTSSPICRKLGFREIGTLRMYVKGLAD